jgi:hypothetical protein
MVAQMLQAVLACNGQGFLEQWTSGTSVVRSEPTYPGDVEEREKAPYLG